MAKSAGIFRIVEEMNQPFTPEQVDWLKKNLTIELSFPQEYDKRGFPVPANFRIAANLILCGESISSNTLDIEAELSTFVACHRED